MAGRIVIVGNGPLSRDFTQSVDSADFVLRFNEPKASIGLSGTRTDLLMINNTGKPMQRRLDSADYFKSPLVQAAREIMFPYHPITIRNWMIKPNPLSRLINRRRADWTLPALERFGEEGKPVHIMPPAFYVASCAEIGIPGDRMGKLFPSTGYLGLRHIFQRFADRDWSAEIIGFSFEGWSKHSWANERGWVEARISEGRLTQADPAS